MALRQIVLYPSGQEIRDVVFHTQGEIDSFIRTLDPTQYTISSDMFDELPDKWAGIAASVNFQSRNVRFGATGYDVITFQNGLDNQLFIQGNNCAYFLSIRSESDWRLYQQNSTGQSGPTGQFVPDNSVRVQPSDGQWRKIRIYKICFEPRRVSDDGGDGPVMGPPLIYEEENIPDVPTLGSGQVYVDIDPTDILTELETISTGLWTNNLSLLENPNTASFTTLQTSSSVNHILHVYNNPQDDTECFEQQYSIIYADYDGKGARDLGGLDNQTLTKAMYTQYANILLPHGQNKFNFNGTDEDYVYIIDIKRDRYKYALDPGNWQMTLVSCSFSNDIDIDSVLEDMQTASFQSSPITLVDTLTRQNTKSRPVYFSNRGYDIKIGTLEQGVGTNYVTSSIISSSVATGTATHVIQSTTPGSTTAIITGTKVYYWTHPTYNGPYMIATCSFKMYKTDEGIDSLGNPYANYTGNWTGSLKPGIGSGATIQNIIYSGSMDGAWDYYLGGKFRLGTGITTKDRTLTSARPVRLTENYINYKGNIKFGPYKILNNTTQQYATYTASYGQSVITGTFTGSAEAVFYGDGWGIADYIDTGSIDPLPTGDTSGFVLIPVKSDAYGKVYPNHGIIVLSGKKMDELGFNTNRSVERNGYNTYRLFHSMKLVLDKNLTDLSGDSLGFIGRAVELKYNKYCFIRVGNRRLNYSNNPTYQSGSVGDIIPEFTKKNQAYFTSIGIYNQNKELLAVGKVSKALVSSMTKESLFTVRIGQ